MRFSTINEVFPAQNAPAAEARELCRPAGESAHTSVRCHAHLHFYPLFLHGSFRIVLRKQNRISRSLSYFLERVRRDAGGVSAYELVQTRHGGVVLISLPCFPVSLSIILPVPLEVSPPRHLTSWMLVSPSFCAHSSMHCCWVCFSFSWHSWLEFLLLHVIFTTAED